MHIFIFFVVCYLLRAKGTSYALFFTVYLPIIGDIIFNV